MVQEMVQEGSLSTATSVRMAMGVCSTSWLIASAAASITPRICANATPPSTASGAGRPWSTSSTSDWTSVRLYDTAPARRKYVEATATSSPATIRRPHALHNR